MSSNPNPSSITPSEKLKAKDAADPAPEELLWTGTYSGKAMVGTWLVLLVASIALIVAYWMIPALQTPTARYVMLAILVLGWVIPLFQLAYRKLAYFYELSNQRLKHRNGILVRHHNRVEVIDIDDVTFKQGIVETMFNVGTIRIRSSDTSHPELVMHGISDVKRVSDMIDTARRNERMKRGLYVESI